MSTPSPLLHPYGRTCEHERVILTRGEGCYVFDDRGREYFDAGSSLWYCSLGHGNRRVLDRMSRQARELDTFHTFERFSNPPVEELSARLVEVAPMPNTRVFYTSGGSEAVDTALKLVRLTHYLNGSNRSLIVSRIPSYHGVTYGALSMMGIESNREGFGPFLPGFERFPHDDLGAIEDLAERHGDQIAAVIAEPVIAGGGLHPPVPGYLDGLRRICDATGALLILDEVVCGFGRLGEWWGADRYGVEPDLVTFAKGATSGYFPLGGVLVGAVVREALERDAEQMLLHGYTYGGHPVGAAAACEVMNILVEDNLFAQSRRIEQHLESMMTQLKHAGLIESHRGAGAMRALEVADRGEEFKVALRDNGIICRPVGPRAVAICPPLVATPEDLDDLHHRLTSTLTIHNTAGRECRPMP